MDDNGDRDSNFVFNYYGLTGLSQHWDLSMFHLNWFGLNGELRRGSLSFLSFVRLFPWMSLQCGSSCRIGLLDLLTAIMIGRERSGNQVRRGKGERCLILHWVVGLYFTNTNRCPQ